MARVAIFGGGVAGLTAADELSRRGFRVTVYEARNVWGGKARSLGRWGTSLGGRPELPGEHGFRFFPGFYKHVPATMAGIATASGSVFDALVDARTVLLAQDEGRPHVEIPSRFPRNKAEWNLAFATFHDRARLGLSRGDLAQFACKVLDIMAMCDARRLAELEHIPWWQYLDAGARDKQYQKLLAVGLTRTLVAMKAEQASTRTVGNIFIQLLIYAFTPGKATDRVLNGPTSTAWIEPWIEQLGERCELQLNCAVQKIDFDGAAIAAVQVDQGGGSVQVTADYYVFAVPVEVMSRLLTPALCAVAPSLARLGELEVEWMNGVVFYLKQDVTLTPGHVILVDSAWALTAISQAQFWAEPVTDYGSGATHGVLSVDISDWSTNGTHVVHRAAADCTALQIAQESWAQIKAHFPQLTDAALIAPLEDPGVRSWFLDPDIHTCASATRGLLSVAEQVQRNGAAAVDRNAEPLLINTQGSWAKRPDAVTAIANLLLAADYVRTFTDLATMEAANEAARRAVNAILDREKADAQRCAVYPLQEWAVFAPLRALDARRFARGRRAINWHWLWWIVLLCGAVGGVIVTGVWRLFHRRPPPPQ